MRREFLSPGPKADLGSLMDLAGMESHTRELAPLWGGGGIAASMSGLSAEF